MISAIDLFCGAGGLSAGLKEAGIAVLAGVDLDESCEYPFTANIDASFIHADVSELTAEELDEIWDDAEVRALVGCAPCQPFSPYRRGKDTSKEKNWPLLSEFGRLVDETQPDLVTMENVPRIGSSSVFQEFVSTLEDAGYRVDWRSCYGPDYGLAQTRRRLVLVASKFGPIEVPAGSRSESPPTVREVIEGLPKISAGETYSGDALHRSRNLSEMNLKRIKASTPGGTWEDWPDELLSDCHRSPSGKTFRNVYARMEWDKPAPTITTLSHNFGTGRFGHPEQDRPISLREAAMLQGFTSDYKFVPADEKVSIHQMGRLIGNAVPPPLGKAVGDALVRHVEQTKEGTPND